MSTFIAAAMFVTLSVSILAYMLNRRRSRSDVSSMRKALLFIGGPFPLWVSIHFLVLLLLIITVHESRGAN